MEPIFKISGVTMLRFLFLFAVMAIASGCSVIPDDISVADDTNLVSYNRAVTGGDGVIGQTARWGGIIVEVENKPQQTFVEIVNFPLNHYGKPNANEETIGRFKVKMDGFVDPINFEKGRLITFVGEVQKPIAGMVGEQPYMYPLIMGDNFHLWRENSVNYIHPLFFDYRMGWYSPFYYGAYRPFYSPWNYGLGFSTRYRYNDPAIIRSSRKVNINRASPVNRPVSNRGYTNGPQSRPASKSQGARKSKE